ncbi:MAG: alpha/beta hydrolase, partial [Emcibacteraceae bacterium]|nr:alpha/beta hydrolase [Emcibacteraceae bacterium]
MADTFKTADGLTIDYEVSGDGAALVMLHSGMMSREDMREQIDYFSEFNKVIAIDAREQGRSSSSSVTISYDLMASDVIGVLDHLNIEKANLWGQSDGGVTALIVTHKYPSRVSKLIIHGAVYNHSAYPMSQKERWKNSTWNKNDEQDNDPKGFPGMAFKHYLLGRDDLSNFENHLQEMSMMWATSPN